MPFQHQRHTHQSQPSTSCISACNRGIWCCCSGHGATRVSDMNAFRPTQYCCFDNFTGDIIPGHPHPQPHTHTKIRCQVKCSWHETDKNQMNRPKGVFGWEQANFLGVCFVAGALTTLKHFSKCVLFFSRFCDYIWLGVLVVGAGDWQNSIDHRRCDNEPICTVSMWIHVTQLCLLYKGCCAVWQLSIRCHHQLHPQMPSITTERRFNNTLGNCLMDIDFLFCFFCCYAFNAFSVMARRRKRLLTK